MPSTRRSLLAAAVVASIAGVGAVATLHGGGGPLQHDYDQQFKTPVDAWPADGSAPAGYTTGMSNFLSYADGISGMYYPSRVLTIHDGLLDFYDHDGMGAAVLPFGYSGFRYGTLSVRMCIAGSSGYRGFHNAFLLWPDSGRWPLDGEIDFPEQDTWVATPHIAVHQAVAVDTYGTANASQTWTGGHFHTYTTQRGPGFVSGYQDGKLVSRATKNLPDTDMHPVLQSQWAGLSRPSSSYGGHTLVSRITFDRSYEVSPSHFG